MSMWREATEDEKQAWLSGYAQNHLAFRETDNGLEVMDAARWRQAGERAELAFSQALWYAWGRLDSGQYAGKGLDAFLFAEHVKSQTMAFECQETFHLDSIQNAWTKFVEAETS